MVTLLNPAAPPSLILGRNGRPAGETTTSQAHDEAATTGRIDNHLAAMLAGHAAELVILGDVSAGSGGPADSDLGQATRLAAMAEASLGLGETGLVWSDVSNDAIFHHQMAARPALQGAVHRPSAPGAGI